MDMQNDFITGTLKNDAAKTVIPFIKEQIEKARKEGTRIVYTYDTHEENYMDTMEGKKLPVKHCVENTEGWKIVKELEPSKEAVWAPTMFHNRSTKIKNDFKIKKPTFGYSKWDDFIQPGDEVDICGTVTSICVAANASAIKQIPDVEVNVLTRGCADLNPELQDAALKVLKAQQCNIIE